MSMSKAGLYQQATSEYGEQFSAEAAQYAIDNVQADWNANALKKAQSYQETMSMSPSAIYDQLVSEYGEQFTPEEADYAIANLSLRDPLFRRPAIRSCGPFLFPRRTNALLQRESPLQ